MASLLIFNPEHDIALASDLAHFTAPHAARQLRADLGYLPSLWAEEEDVVMETKTETKTKTKTGAITKIEPWGWDKALRLELERMGVSPSLLPTDDYLEHVRQLSHRRTAARLLPSLRLEGTVGEVFECTAVDEVHSLLKQYGHVVVKAPWSSSGRGVRFVNQNENENQNENYQLSTSNWMRNVIRSQGSVMVEPYYHKIKDFGMEFEATDEGIRYLGLSLFHTANGAYTGNILATECVKRKMLSRYLSMDLVDAVQQKIKDTLDLGDYRGPFGIDMMVCDGHLLHPCVEINVRRTMGHVALALAPTDDDIVKVMQIAYDGKHYKLKINKLQ